MADVLISIIITTYNSGDYIEGCLESILCQTFNNYEIIIQDGGSVDKTLLLIEKIKVKYANSIIRVFKEKDNGIYDAMNLAFVKAAGVWVYFLGSDDRFYSNYVLEKLFRRKEIENYNVIYGNVKIVGNTSWARDGEVYDGEFDTRKILNKNICHQSIFYRRSFFKDIGLYKTNYRLCADWDYNLRCWSATDFLYVDEVIAYFNAGGESTKNKLDIPFKNDFLNNVLSYFNISAFNDLVNSNQFHLFDEVVKLQKNEFYLKYLTTKFKSRLKQIIHGH